MKIAFDEHVPVQMVRVFASLGAEKRFRGFEFVSAKDYAPKPTDPDYIRKSDVPWLERFHEAGGRIVVSGNVRMMEEPLEMQALRQLGFTVFFFERKWNRWDFYQKSALVLFYWERISSKIKRAKPGKFWRIPNHFKEDDNLRDVSPGKKQIKRVGPHVPKKKSDVTEEEIRSTSKQETLSAPRMRKGKRRRPPDQNQTSLSLTGGGMKGIGDGQGKT